jgi:hypothetical protein
VRRGKALAIACFSLFVLAPIKNRNLFLTPLITASVCTLLLLTEQGMALLYHDKPKSQYEIAIALKRGSLRLNVSASNEFLTSLIILIISKRKIARKQYDEKNKEGMTPSLF